jgi:hypothetical protein
MQIFPSTAKSVNAIAANTAKPINVHLGWEIFLNRVFRERTDKGLWLHWYHPADRNREQALRYGYFIAPNQTLEEALHAVYQSIEAIVELESMENARSFVQAVECLEADRALLAVNA